MNEQKLYAVKDDKGYYWEFKDLCGIDLGGFWELLDVSVPFTVSEDDAKNTAKDHGGNVVELVDAPAKIVVSEAEAKMLKRSKSEHFWATNVIQNYIDMHMDGMSNDEKQQFEDRLMRAYVVGWTVEKPKRWNVKVPHVNNGYYYKDSDGLAVFTAKRGRMLQERSQFTLEEIEQYGLQDCEKEEVRDEG